MCFKTAMTGSLVLWDNLINCTFVRGFVQLKNNINKALLPDLSWKEVLCQNLVLKPPLFQVIFY